MPCTCRTTDPAAHVAFVRRRQPARPDGRPHRPGASRRSATSTRSWRRAAATSTSRARRCLREDLASPCTEEVAVFHAFSRIVAEARSAFVVLDTAPTGHTLLLMDATGAYHRQMMHDLDPTAPGPHRHAAHAAAGPRLHEGHPGDPAGDDAGLRSGRAPGRPAARPDRALCLGRSTAASPPPESAIPCCTRGWSAKRSRSRGS